MAETSRTEKFLARVRAHLPDLPSNARRVEWLDGQIEAWEARFSLFIETQGEAFRKGDGADQPVAADFVDTLAALQIERSKYQGSIAA